MLYLNRKPGEAVIINHTIEVRVVEVRGRTVKLGFTFPPEATVLREEVVRSVEQANRAALAGVRALPGEVRGRLIGAAGTPKGMPER
jgi:carbon storage regulator